MFYIHDSEGSYIVGYVEKGSTEAVMHYGFRDRYLRKELAFHDTTEEAYQVLCMQMHKARLNGWEDRDVALSPIDLPECVRDALPASARGVYAQVNSCNQQQFEAGQTMLQAAVGALSETFPVSLICDAGGFCVKSNGGAVKVTFLSDAVWETYPLKLKEITTARGFFDSSSLMPSGVGRLGFSTCETGLDIFVRAFLAGMIQAGADVTVTGDCDWAFKADQPFDKAQVMGLDWYNNTALALYDKLVEADLAKGLVAKTYRSKLLGNPFFT